MTRPGRDAADTAARGRWREEGGALLRDEGYEDFAAALARLNRIAALAEREDHHPDLYLHDWNRLTITLTSHDAGGITDRDRRMASLIEDLD